MGVNSSCNKGFVSEALVKQVLCGNPDLPPPPLEWLARLTQQTRPQQATPPCKTRLPLDRQVENQGDPSASTWPQMGGAMRLVALLADDPCDNPVEQPRHPEDCSRTAAIHEGWECRIGAAAPGRRPRSTSNGVGPESFDTRSDEFGHTLKPGPQCRPRSRRCRPRFRPNLCPNFGQHTWPTYANFGQVCPVLLI